LKKKRPTPKKPVAKKKAAPKKSSAKPATKKAAAKKAKPVAKPTKKPAAAAKAPAKAPDKKPKKTKVPPELIAALADPTKTALRLEVETLPPELGQATWLKELSTGKIGKPFLGSEALATLVDLEELSIWGNCDEAPAALSGMKKLRELRIHIANAPTAELIADLTSLEKLDLFIGDFMKPDVEFPRWIGRLVNLKDLRLNGPMGAIGDEIGALAGLEALEFGHGVHAQPRLPDGVAALKRLRELQINVHALDSRIGELTDLELLEIRSQKTLTQLPAEIGRLTKLTKLTLTSNGLTSLPPEIGALVNLTSLDVQSNALTSIPPEIGKLTKLTDLDITCNPVRVLPPEIGQLSSLTSFKFGSDKHLDAGVEALPPEIGQLKLLRSLWSHGGRLTTLPREIGGCEALKTLYLPAHPITSVPPEIGQLKKLEWLSFAETPLAELPVEIEGCTALKELDLTGCSFPQASYDRIIAFKASRGNHYDFKMPRLDKKRPPPPATGSTTRLGPKVLEALAKKGLVIESPAEIPEPNTRKMKGGAEYPVPEAMRQFIRDVKWPAGIRYEVTFGSWKFDAIDFRFGVDLTEYECSFHRPFDGLLDLTNHNMLVWDMSDPDPGDPRLYRIDHDGWSEHDAMSLGVRLSTFVQKMKPKPM